MNLIAQKDKIYTVLLLIVCMTFIMSNFIWLESNKIMENTSLIHLKRSIDLSYTLKDTQMNLCSKARAIFSPWQRKPHYLFLYHLLPALFSFPKDKFYNYAIMLNNIYLCVLLFSVFGICKYLYGDPRIGLLSSFIVFTCPIIFSLSRWFIPTFALTAMTALAIYFLLKTEGFKNIRYVYCFFISLLLGTFIGLVFIFYIMLPFLFVLTRAIIREKKLKYFLLTVFFLFLSLAVLSLMFTAGVPGWLKQNKIISFEQIALNSRYYLNGLLNAQLYIFHFILLLLGVIMLIVRPKRCNLILLLWFFGLVVFMGSVDFLDSSRRFTAPFLIPAAIGFSCRLFKINNRIFRRILCSAIVLVSAFIFLETSFALFNRVLPDEKFIESPFVVLPVYRHVTWSETHPIKEDWKTKEIALFLMSKVNKNDPAHIAFAPNMKGLNPFIMEYYFSLYKYPYNSLYFRDFVSDFYLYFLKSDYVFVKTGTLMNNLLFLDQCASSLEEVERFIIKPPDRFLDRFKLIKEFDFPDGSKGMLYETTGADPLDTELDERIDSLKEIISVNNESMLAHLMLAGAYKRRGLTGNSNLEYSEVEGLIDKAFEGLKPPLVFKKIPSYIYVIKRILYEESGLSAAADMEFEKTMSEDSYRFIKEFFDL